jgi:hypothetical protein
MEDIQSIIEESKALIRGLETGNEVRPPSNPDNFRATLLTFMEAQMASVQNRQGLLDLVDAEILRKLALHELDVTDLRQLRNDLMQAGTSRLSAILEPFKATNATPNSLINPPNPENNGDKDLTKSLTPEERQAIAKLAQVMERANSRKKGEIEDGLPV